MKKLLLFSLYLIFIGNYLLAQVAGDYRSNIPVGNWNSPASWEKYDGSAWLVSTDYPGQNPVASAITIQPANIINLNVSPPNPIGSLAIQGGGGLSLLFISPGFTLNVAGQVQINPPATGLNTILMGGVAAQLNCASLTLVESGADNMISALALINGIVNVTGNVTMGTTQPQRTIITFAQGTLNIGGNLSGGTIAAGIGTINFNGSGTQTVGNATPIIFYNLGITNAASTLQLNGNITVSNTLALTNGKINTQTNTLTLTNAVPGSQITGGTSSSSYVYSTGAGRLIRNGLTATANNFPVGTSAYYMPVIVTPTTVSNFAVNVFTPATTNGAEGGPAFADKSAIVDAVWNIDRLAAGTGDATITIEWVDALEGVTFATYGNGQIGVSQNVSGIWEDPKASSANAAANTVTATFNTFSPFMVVELEIEEALPVKFGPIKAYEKQNGIQVDWKVYSEYNVKNYEIERSSDGRSYTIVGSLPALYNNLAEGDYGFFDANPLPGTSFYRIKNNDLDGKSSYSIVVRVNRNKSVKGLSLYPNPIVNGIVLLRGSDLDRGNYKINIFGANGQEIYRQQIKHNGGTISQTIQLPLTIGKGIYMFSVRDENGNIIFKEKLVNQ